ncbi:hypothetical protein AJ85_18115 [Alkalihalobacillus alcalophilus ATCC 27647 = CGMCC 1.3604]|uniref:Uncharacterized protein n=1 Tax=Alkalihalobacillus alcalophilus ATCC 27647 = CGMCC 1.3604 TaxID=1218173 RepID=A0A094YQV3_ALKAL|nr:hypothetical protein [Alkalihalobacillus alcalophilus]KGA95832.1 hypothetical protein BALCAV_0219950 [Alkalihalobacillus alcalophilus ATCC 27647 = CGMCC 1.3604]MED1562061.1 hypothetical protein [Alkalihalobacillus alcalophilus]THG89366.1 hypothetical protein AJ85_18115 [Alkalihalobacillus alcalophilus ATCC 27647 = CGMCC 1.3604]
MKNKKFKDCDFLGGVKLLVSERKVFSVFKTFIRYVRDEITDEKEREEVLDYAIGILEEACLAVLKCNNCNVPYQFRFFRNPSAENEEEYALELNCEGCNDYYTFSEGEERISYFNFNVIKKVDNLRRWGRGLKMKMIKNRQGKAALLWMDDNEQPTLLLNVSLVRKPNEVEDIWKKAKVTKQLINDGKDPNVQSLEVSEKKFYIIK